MALASGSLGSLGPCLHRYTRGVRRPPLSREAELTTRLLKFREHRARLLAASRTQTDPPDADEILRRRLIARAEGQIARIEGSLRPKRAYLRGPAVS
jgi:hypothetical protein